jgi:hypothetical protein
MLFLDAECTLLGARHESWFRNECWKSDSLETPKDIGVPLLLVAGPLTMQILPILKQFLIPSTRAKLGDSCRMWFGVRGHPVSHTKFGPSFIVWHYLPHVWVKRNKTGPFCTGMQTVSTCVFLFLFCKLLVLNTCSLPKLERSVPYHTQHTVRMPGHLLRPHKRSYKFQAM